MAKDGGLTRRKAIGLGLSSAAAAAAGTSFGLNILNRPQPRNVIFIVSDSLRADRLGCYGYRREVNGVEAGITPNIDALAREGVVFQRCLSTSSWTLPSTASYMTSRLPFVEGDAYNEGFVGEECRTCAEILDGRGWATVAIIHNPYLFVRSETGERELVARRGFQRYLTGGLLRKPNPLFEQGIGREEVFSGFANAAAAVKRSVAVLSEFATTARPFFLYIHLMDTHEPYDPPDEYKATCTAPPIEGVPDYVLYHLVRTGARRLGARSIAEEDMPYFERARDLYDAATAFVDEWVGRLVGFLKTSGLWKSSLVVFSSDHGEEFAEHGWIGHSTTLYDESLSVPLIMAGRGVATPARVSKPVSMLDVAPTILASCEVNAPNTMLGAPLPLDGSEGEAPRAAAAMLVKPAGPGETFEKKYAVIEPRGLKYIFTRHVGNQAGRGEEEELYDLRSDPAETANVAKENAEALSILRRRLESLKRTAASKEGKPFTVDDEARKVLESLGYLQH